MSDEARQILHDKLTADLTLAAMAPDRVTILLLGDFNIYKKAPMYPRAPEIDKRRSACDTADRPRAQFWRGIFGRMMEVDNELPTHYVSNEWQPKLTQTDFFYFDAELAGASTSFLHCDP